MSIAKSIHNAIPTISKLASPSLTSRLQSLSRQISSSAPARMPLISQSPKNRVILGLMTFGPPGTEAKGARVTTLDDYNSCLDYFQKEGYNEVDTARAYIQGDQEAWSKEAKWKERGLTLATKCYPAEPGMHSAERLKASANKSLRELDADCVDIFYLHAPDRSVPFEETLQACNELHKQGKFVQLGLSNFAAWEVAECVNICRERGWVQPRVYQAMYNAITRAIEPELIPCCRKYGIDIVVYNPLAGGILSGKYKSKDHVPSEGRFANTSARTGEMYRKRYFQDATFEALALIEPVAKKFNLTLLEVALRWCVHHSQLQMVDGTKRDGVIIGVSSLKQLEGNLTNLEKGPLPEEVVQTLDEAWNICKASGPTYWR